jgi:hypothetical protein
VEAEPARARSALDELLQAGLVDGRTSRSE